MLQLANNADMITLLASYCQRLILPSTIPYTIKLSYSFICYNRNRPKCQDNFIIEYWMTRCEL